VAVETRGRLRHYWTRVEFLKEKGFAYVKDREAYVDASGWALTGSEIYDSLDTMTFEVFCAYVIKRPVEGDA